jgi:plasmid stabilization system protein ParE
VNVVLRPEADAEINEIIRYYDAQQPGLGDEFFLALDDELVAIGNNPRRCGWLDDRYRKCRLRGFPYSIIYDTATWPPVVVAVVHQSRHPDVWRRRLQ